MFRWYFSWLLSSKRQTTLQIRLLVEFIVCHCFLSFSLPWRFLLVCFLPWVCKNLNFVVSFQMLERMLKVSCFFARVWFNNCATLVLLSSVKNCCQSSYNYQVMSEMWQLYLQQVCIPVGCVPPACLTVSQHALCRGGVYVPACTGQGCVYPSMYWAGGVCLLGCLPRGVSAWGQGGCLPDTYPVDRMTDRFKNITLPQRNFVAGGKNYIFLSKSDRQLRNLRLTNYQWTL